MHYYPLSLTYKYDLQFVVFQEKPIKRMSQSKIQCVVYELFCGSLVSNGKHICARIAQSMLHLPRVLHRQFAYYSAKILCK